MHTVFGWHHLVEGQAAVRSALGLQGAQARVRGTGARARVCVSLIGLSHTRSCVLVQFPDATGEDIHRLLGYFLYYRFINIAIVAPDTFGLVESKEISPEIRGGLTDVAKVLQNLFNLLLFTDREKRYACRCVCESQS